MKKNYNNRAMTTETKEQEGEVYFFPKNNPPISIKAGSREEAEEELKALNNKKEV